MKQTERAEYQRFHERERSVRGWTIRGEPIAADVLPLCRTFQRMYRTDSRLSVGKHVIRRVKTRPALSAVYLERWRRLESTRATYNDDNINTNNENLSIVMIRCGRRRSTVLIGRWRQSAGSAIKRGSGHTYQLSRTRGGRVMKAALCRSHITTRPRRRLNHAGVLSPKDDSVKYIIGSSNVNLQLCSSY